MNPRRLVHHGAVLAAAFWIDEAIIGQEAARRRILEMPGVNEVRRMENGLFVRLREPLRIICTHAPGMPLVVCRGILLGVPLDDDELESLAAPSGNVVLVRAGEAVVIDPATCRKEDISTWIDLADWTAEPVEPLGDVLTSPRAAPAAKEIDPRQIAGIGEPPKEAAAIVEALAQARMQAAEKNSTGFASSLLTSLSSWLSSIAAKLGRSSTSSNVLPRQTTANRSLVVAPSPQKPGSDWTDRLRMMLNTAAARLLIWARLASWIGRRQAEYLEKTFSLFDEGNLDEALRHAIPLGTGSDKPKPLALSVPTPRADLSIRTTKSEASSTLGFGDNVFEALRIRYRKAVEQLEKQGKIKEAAFVLAELLGASEEAVSFLEKHREYQLAAELAEGRNLDPALVVRQWILAGNRERAVLIARRTGAFAAAVARLETTHPEHAAVLRILWAHQLAASGAYGAAVQTIWPVEKARHLAREWIERGIEIGGTVGARLLATKAWLMPEEFAAVAGAIRGLPRDESETTVGTWTALAQSVVANPSSKTMRILARACLRTLTPHAREKAAKSLLERLVTAADDPVLLADMRRQTTTGAPKVTVRARALADVGLGRNLNEDAFLIASLERNRRVQLAEIPNDYEVPPRGILLAVADGLGGYKGSEVATLALNTIAKHAETAGHDSNTISNALVNAVTEAGVVIYQRAAKDHYFRGAGATITAAWIHSNTAWIAQVGDTRAYLMRRAHLEQLTQDHSLINELLQAGKLTPEQVESFEHNSVVTRALGVVEQVKVDLYRVPLVDGDRLFLCTDGIHGVVEHERMVEALRTSLYARPNQFGDGPNTACMMLKERAYDAGAPDNIAMIVCDIRIQNGAAVQGSVIAEKIATEKEEQPAPTTRIISRSAADVGTLAIHDAVVLPGGRLLLALGEVGVRLISPQGKTLVQFDQPAERLVISDHGDRAIALARRGEAHRTARIDIVRRKAERWFDAILEDFADSFDGALWFVFNDRGAFAIDALEESFSALWEMRERNSVMGTRSPHAVSLRVGHEAWTLDQPSFRVRNRRELPVRDDTSWPNVGLATHGRIIAWVKNEATSTYAPATREPHETSWSVLGEGVPEGLFPRVVIDDMGVYGAFGRFGSGHCTTTVFDLQTKKARIEVHLEGATLLRTRFQQAHVIITDDRGRVIVVNAATGKIMGEWRI